MKKYISTLTRVDQIEVFDRKQYVNYSFLL